MLLYPPLKGFSQIQDQIHVYVYLHFSLPIRLQGVLKLKAFTYSGIFEFAYLKVKWCVKWIFSYIFRDLLENRWNLRLSDICLLEGKVLHEIIFCLLEGKVLHEMLIIGKDLREKAWNAMLYEWFSWNVTYR